MPVSSGNLRKMKVTLEKGKSPVAYELVQDDALLPLNELVGKSLKLEYTGAINCTHCGRKTNKSFNQGYCYPCFKSLAQCDQCIVSPEKCHFHLGTCREPQWADDYCMQDHYVYLANSSGLKVGITRGSQVPTRWIDQGAVAALPLFRVASRRLSGLVEVALKQHVADKTNWRAMLKGSPEPVDLGEAAERLLGEISTELDDIHNEYGLQSVQRVEAVSPVEIHYPVEQYPEKVVSLNFDKSPLVEGVLMGIKGQYLLLDSGVLNIRKFGGYHIDVSY